MRFAKILSVAAFLASPFASALAQSGEPLMVGAWQGSYVCLQGRTGLTLTIDRQTNETFSGYFHFYPLRRNPAAKEGCYSVEGRRTADNRVVITTGSWITRPPGYVMVGLDGLVTRSGKSMAGNVTSPAFVETRCQKFALRLQNPRPEVDAICRGALTAQAKAPAR